MLLTLIACSSDGGISSNGELSTQAPDLESPTELSTSLLRPRVTATVPAGLTGIALVDAVASAVEGADVERLMELLAPVVGPCAGPFGPGCRQGESQAPTVWYTVCSSERRRPEDIKPILNRFLPLVYSFEGVYETSAIGFGDPDIQLVAVFRKNVDDVALPRRISLWMTQEGIVNVWLLCPSGSRFPGEVEGNFIYRELTPTP